MVELQQAALKHMLQRIPLVLGLAVGAVIPIACSEAEEAKTQTATIQPVQSVIIDLSEKTDASGRLLSEIQLISDNGKASLEIPEGTMVSGEDGFPVEAIHITQQFQWTIAYEIGPAGAGINPPARLQICYNPEQLPAFERNNTPELGFFEKTQESWSWLELVLETDRPCVSATIDRLGTFVLIFDIPKGIPQSQRQQEVYGFD